MKSWHPPAYRWGKRKQIMKKTNFIRYVQSLVLLPVMTVSMQVAPISGAQGVAGITASSISATLNLAGVTSKDIAESDIAALAQKITEQKAAAVDAYFKAYDMPLEGTGKKMVEEAEKNGLDWRLVAAISVRESTGGKHDCIKVTNNPFGWGSCKIGFKSNDAAIETVARNLGGNNPNTAHHYDNKTTIEILRAYNPPSIVPQYAQQVMKIMDTMGPAEITIPTNTLASNTEV